ncbi:hypothetical protein LJC48_05410 [Desulfovibrio sp. OttesenSCG-928-C06]|nr:hypothetical protein [Desulfovibrio sp. OttesenSCG-928-C06]
MLGNIPERKVPGKYGCFAQVFFTDIFNPRQGGLLLFFWVNHLPGRANCWLCLLFLPAVAASNFTLLWSAGKKACAGGEKVALPL